MTEEPKDTDQMTARSPIRPTEQRGSVGWKRLIGVSSSAEGQSSQSTDDVAVQELFRDIDAIIARLDKGIAEERAAMDTLLHRLMEDEA